MEPQELASELHVHLVRGDQAVNEHGIHKMFNALEGDDALAKHLQNCGMPLRQFLNSFPQFFLPAGPGQWRAVSTNSYNTVLTAASNGGSKNNKKRGGGNRGSSRGGRGTPMRGGIFRNRGGGINSSFRSNNARQNGASFQSFQSNNSRSNNSSNQFNRYRSPSRSPPPRAPPRHDFPYNNQQDNRSFTPPYDNQRNNNQNNYRTWSPEVDEPQYNASRGYFEESAYEPSRIRSRSPPMKYQQDYDDDRYRRQTPSPPPRNMNPRNDSYYSRKAPGDGPREGAYDDSYRKYNDDPRDSHNSQPPRERFQKPRRINRQEEDLDTSVFSQFSDSSSLPSTSARPAASNGELSDLEDLFNTKLKLASSTPLPPNIPEPPGLERPLEENEITRRQAKKCRKAFKHLELRSVLMRDFIAGVELELRDRLPGNNDDEKAVYILKLQKIYGDMMSTFWIDGGVVKRAEPEEMRHRASRKVEEQGNATSSSAINTGGVEFFQCDLGHPLCSAVRNSRDHQVEITRFRNFTNFSVRIVEELNKYEKMDREIQSTMEDVRISPRAVPMEVWRKNHACLYKGSDPNKVEKWHRGVVLRVEIRIIRLYLIDTGMVVMANPSDIVPMPSTFTSIPPFALQCVLGASPDEIEDLELDIRKWEKKFSENQFERTFICPVAESIQSVRDGVKACRVELFVSVLGSNKSVIDFNI